MSKITLKIDSSLSYDKALEEFEKIYNQELLKNKERQKFDSFLSNLHKLVNSQIDTKFSNTNGLIQALIPYTTSAFKEKLSKKSAGRRKTISMNKEIFLKIKDLLNRPKPNKAAIGREVGVSVVQVRKVAVGGYDKKFGSTNSTVSKKAEANKGAIATPNQSVLPLPNYKKAKTNLRNSVTRPPMKLAPKSPLDL